MSSQIDAIEAYVNASPEHRAVADEVMGLTASQARCLTEVLHWREVTGTDVTLDGAMQLVRTMRASGASAG